MALPTGEDVEKALHFLSEKEEEYARTKAALTAKKEGVKVAESIALLKSQGANAAERTAKARSSAEYKTALEDLEQAEYNKEYMSLKFKRAELVIEVWRTVQANQRRSVI